MKTKTLAQVANDIENGNNLHEYYNNDGATIKAGNFESFGDFLSYYRQHYRPILEQVADGITPTGDNARLLRLLASDLLDIFKEDSDESEDKEEEDPTLTEAEKRDTLCRLWDAAWQQARQDPETYRVIVETNEEDPTAPANEFGRYYMVDFWQEDGLWHVIRVDTVTSPYEVHRPNFAAAHGYSDDETQLACRCENPNNVTRWARLMIDAGRVTDIYADCY
ncbi:MAG: hypothetical protein IKN51_06590 [Bacteroidaceae bacterium]|nr:hypothetical protein [Bacteroidaceae bacterium]